MPNEFKQLAEQGARKICGRGTCMCGYQCDHENCGHDNSLSLLGSNTVCPLSKYNVVPDKRPWYELGRAEAEVDDSEIFSLCACCEYAEMEGESSLRRKDLMICLDCPVKWVEEAINECCAES